MKQASLQHESSPPAEPRTTESTWTPTAPDERYRVGTLQYTRAGLITLFCWLLWGDFCFALMETVIPSVLPLKLQSLGAPNLLMGFLVLAIPHGLNIFLNPIISFRSDRHRGRWGRRIPFLFWATPFIALFLILLGFSESISGFLYATVFRKFSTLSPVTVTLIVMSVLLVGFSFFNNFVISVYYYLFNDVVPQAFVARCTTLFRLVGSAAVGLYNLLIFRYAKTHMREIFVGAGCLYLAAFLMMCWKVKEGRYPPPPENVGGKTGIRAAVRTYLTECFTHRFYWYFFLANALWSTAGCIAIFGVLLSQSLGLTLTQIGYIGAGAQLGSALLLYPAGILADRTHPLRVYVGAIIIIFLFAPVDLIYLFFNPTPHTVLAVTIAVACVVIPFNALVAASAMPMYMRLLPKDRYGQFCSANAMVQSSCFLLGSLGAGAFLDLMKTLCHGDPYYYRFCPCWSTAFYALGTTFLLLLYREWKRRGGKEGYVPPGTELPPHGQLAR